MFSDPEEAGSEESEGSDDESGDDYASADDDNMSVNGGNNEGSAN